MKDWFVAVHLTDAASAEMFEFIDYRRAVAFADQHSDSGDFRSVAVIDFRGLEVLTMGTKFDGCVGYTALPLRAGFYRWSETADRMVEVRQ